MLLTAREEHLCRLIAQQAGPMLDDLRLYVSLPTGGGHRDGLDELRERLASRLTSLGADFEYFPGDRKPEWLEKESGGGHIPPTAVCRRQAGGLRPEAGGGSQSPASSLHPILIAGHLDTVHDPQGDFRELTLSPDGKTARGPGCVDMKGGLVIAVHALEALEEAGIGASWSFLMNSDEETGSFHSAATLRAEAGRHEFGLALEPALADGSLAVERMGSGQFMVEVRGKSAHVGRAFGEGVSAVTELGWILVRIGQMSDPAAGRIINVGPIEGGNVSNAVPDRARAWGNVRYPSQDVAEEIRGLLEGLATPPDALPAVEVRTNFNRPAKPLIPSTDALARQARAAAEALGQQLPFASTGGVCDGNILQDAGLPTIDTVGVRGGGLHTPQEWIEVPSLVERCQLLAVLIERLSGGEPA